MVFLLNLIIDVKLDNDYTDTFGVRHFYFTRVSNGIAVLNQNAAVHIKNSEVVYYSSSFQLSSRFTEPSSPKLRRGLSNTANGLRTPISGSSNILCEQEAIAAAEHILGIAKDESPVTLNFVEIPNEVVYAYTFQLKGRDKWFQVSVNAITGIAYDLNKVNLYK